MRPVTVVPMTPEEIAGARMAARVLVRLRLERDNQAQKYESEVLKLHRIIDKDLNVFLAEVECDSNTDLKKFELAKNEVRYLVKNYRENKRKKSSNNLFDLLMRLVDRSGYIHAAEKKRQEDQARKASIAKQSAEARQSKIDGVFELLANYSQKPDENSALQIKAALVGPDSSDQQFSADDLAAQSSKLIESVDLMKGADTLSALTQRLYQLEQFSEEFRERGDFAAVVTVFQLMGKSLREKLNQQFSAANKVDKDAVCQFMLDHKVFWLDSSSLSENPEGVEEKYRNQFEINKKLKPLTVLVNFWLSGGAHAQRYASIFALLSELMGENFNIVELRKLLRDCEAASSLSSEQADVMLNDLLLLETPKKFTAVIEQRAAVLEWAKAQVIGNEESQDAFEDGLHHDMAGLSFELPNSLEGLIFLFDRVRELKVIHGDNIGQSVLALEIALRLQIRKSFLELAKSPNDAVNAEQMSKLLQFMLRHQMYFLDAAELPAAASDTDLKGSVDEYRHAHRLEMLFDLIDSEKFDELTCHDFAKKGGLDENLAGKIIQSWDFEKLRDRLWQLTDLNHQGKAGLALNQLRKCFRQEFVNRFNELAAQPEINSEFLTAQFRFMTEHRVDWISPRKFIQNLDSESALAQAQKAYHQNVLLDRLMVACLQADMILKELSSALAVLEPLKQLEPDDLRAALLQRWPRYPGVFDRAYTLLHHGALVFMQERNQRNRAADEICLAFNSKLKSSAAKKTCSGIAASYKSGHLSWDDALVKFIEFQVSHPDLANIGHQFAQHIWEPRHFIAYFDCLFAALEKYAASDSAAAAQGGAQEIQRLEALLMAHTWGNRLDSISVSPLNNPRALTQLLANLLHLSLFIDRNDCSNFILDLHEKLKSRLQTTYLVADKVLRSQILDFMCTHQIHLLDMRDIDQPLGFLNGFGRVKFEHSETYEDLVDRYSAITPEDKKYIRVRSEVYVQNLQIPRLLLVIQQSKRPARLQPAMLVYLRAARSKVEYEVREAQVAQVFSTLAAIETYLRKDVGTRAKTYAEYQAEIKLRTRANVKGAFDLVEAAQQFLAGKSSHSDWLLRFGQTKQNLRHPSTSDLHKRLIAVSPLDVMFNAMTLNDEARVAKTMDLVFQACPIDRDPDKAAKAREDYFAKFLAAKDFTTLERWLDILEVYTSHPHSDSLNDRGPQCAVLISALRQQISFYLQAKIPHEKGDVPLKKYLAVLRRDKLDLGAAFFKHDPTQPGKIAPAKLLRGRSVEVKTLIDAYERDLRLLDVLFKLSAAIKRNNYLEVTNCAEQLHKLSPDAREIKENLRVLTERYSRDYLALAPAIQRELNLAAAMQGFVDKYAAQYEASQQAQNSEDGSGANKSNVGGRMMEYADKKSLKALELALQPYFASATTLSELQAALGVALEKLLLIFNQDPRFAQCPRHELVKWMSEYLPSVIKDHPLATSETADALNKLTQTIDHDIKTNPQEDAAEIALVEWRAVATQACLQRRFLSSKFFGEFLPSLVNAKKVQFSDAAAWNPIEDLIKARELLIAALKAKDVAAVARARLALSTMFSLGIETTPLVRPIISLFDSSGYIQMAIEFYNAQLVESDPARIKPSAEQIKRLRAQDHFVDDAVDLPLKGPAILEAIKRAVFEYSKTFKTFKTSEQIAGFFLGDDAKILGDDIAKLIADIRHCEAQEVPGSVNYELALEQLRQQFLRCQEFEATALAQQLREIQAKPLSDLQMALLSSQFIFQWNGFVGALKSNGDEAVRHLNILLGYEEKFLYERLDSATVSQLLALLASVQRAAANGESPVWTKFLDKVKAYLNAKAPGLLHLRELAKQDDRLAHDEEKLLEYWRWYSGFEQSGRKDLPQSLLRISSMTEWVALLASTEGFAAQDADNPLWPAFLSKARIYLDARAPGFFPLMEWAKQDDVLTQDTKTLLNWWTLYFDLEQADVSNLPEELGEWRNKLAAELRSRVARGELGTAQLADLIRVLTHTRSPWLSTVQITSFIKVTALKEGMSQYLRLVVDHEKTNRNIKAIATQLRASLPAQISNELLGKFKQAALVYTRLTLKDTEDPGYFNRIYDERFEKNPVIQEMLAAAQELFAEQESLEAYLQVYAQVMASLFECFAIEMKAFSFSQVFLCIEQLVSAAAAVGNPQFFVPGLSKRASDLVKQIAAFAQDSSTEISSYASPEFVVKMQVVFSSGNPEPEIVVASSADRVAGHPSTIFGPTAQGSRDGRPVSPRSSDGEAETSQQQQLQVNDLLPRPVSPSR